MKLRAPLSTTDRADLRQRAASRIMAADDFTLLQVAGPLGLLERPAGHDAGKPHTAQAYERHRSNQPEEAPMQHETGYLIHKAGRGWYRPNAQGYTSRVDEAGRYTHADAMSYSHPNGWDGPRDGITVKHENEVQAGSNCDAALRIHELIVERDALRAAQEELSQALADANARIATLVAQQRGAEAAVDSFARLSR